MSKYKKINFFHCHFVVFLSRQISLHCRFVGDKFFYRQIRKSSEIVHYEILHITLETKKENTIMCVCIAGRF